MWSTWNAPSDLEYYDPLGVDCDEDDAATCIDCGARWDRLRGLVRNESTSAGAGAGQLPCGRRARGQGRQMIVRGWVTFRAESQADAQSRTAGPRRLVDP